MCKNALEQANESLLETSNAHNECLSMSIALEAEILKFQKEKQV